jgi:hypothetical protein
MAHQPGRMLAAGWSGSTAQGLDGACFARACPAAAGCCHTAACWLRRAGASHRRNQRRAAAKKGGPNLPGSHNGGHVQCAAASHAATGQAGVRAACPSCSFCLDCCPRVVRCLCAAVGAPQRLSHQGLPWQQLQHHHSGRQPLSEEGQVGWGLPGHLSAVLRLGGAGGLRQPLKGPLHGPQPPFPQPLHPVRPHCATYQRCAGKDNLSLIPPLCSTLTTAFAPDCKSSWALMMSSTSAAVCCGGGIWQAADSLAQQRHWAGGAQ